MGGKQHHPKGGGRITTYRTSPHLTSPYLEKKEERQGSTTHGGEKQHHITTKEDGTAASNTAAPPPKTKGDSSTTAKEEGKKSSTAHEQEEKAAPPKRAASPPLVGYGCPLPVVFLGGGDFLPLSFWVMLWCHLLYCFFRVVLPPLLLRLGGVLTTYTIHIHNIKLLWTQT